MQSVRVLTEGLIDYAGLFPPAGLEIGDAVRNYATYVAGKDAAMLGRFILSATKLSEFAATAAAHLPKGPASTPWKLAVLLGDDFETEIKTVMKFNCEHWTGSDMGHAVIDAVEIRVANTVRVERLKSVLPDFYRAFLEVDVGRLDEKLLDAVRDAGFSAKIRTGGIEAASFPPADAVIRFLSACKERGIAFKATAGLHHIVCSSYPLTYEPNSERGEMFGFLNVFLAAAFLFSGASAGDAETILRERDATAFEFHDSFLGWNGMRLSAAEIGKARKEFAVSFGSCSFTEPVEELSRLITQNSTRTN